MKTGTIEKTVCDSCGADVRENTLFCYNCGNKLEIASPSETNGVESADNETKAALDELADKLSHGSESDTQLANAASERKKARVTQRKRNEFTWEPRDDSQLPAIMFSAAVAMAALIVVILLVVWK